MKRETVPDRYGDCPVVKHAVSGGATIPGVVHHDPAGNPVCLTANDDPRTAAPSTPLVRDADCLEGTEYCGDDGGAPRRRRPPGADARPW